MVINLLVEMAIYNFDLFNSTLVGSCHNHEHGEVSPSVLAAFSGSVWLRGGSDYYRTAERRRAYYRQWQKLLDLVTWSFDHVVSDNFLPNKVAVNLPLADIADMQKRVSYSQQGGALLHVLPPFMWIPSWRLEARHLGYHKKIWGSFFSAIPGSSTRGIA